MVISRRRAGLGRFFSPVGAIPNPGVVEACVIGAPEHHHLLMGGIIGHGDACSSGWTGRGRRLGPIRAIPQPGIVEYCEWCYRNVSAEKDHLAMRCIKGHGMGNTGGREVLRDL